MLNLMYCEHCRKKIESYGEMAESAYEAICEYYVTYNECIKIFENYAVGDTGIYLIIKLLEEKGYLISTEISLQSIAVLPRGCELVNGEHRICPFNFNH